MRKVIIIFVLAAMFFSACTTPIVKPEQGTPNPGTANPGTALEKTSATAMYRVTFNATWSASTHPVGFPGGPHFSPLIGASHNSTVTFWELGQVASAGMEQMAETGGTGTLMAEVNVAITAGTAKSILSGSGSSSPGSAQFTFEISQSHSLFTLVSMVAPSPDWFVGVTGEDLYLDDGWIERKEISLPPYDAGSDSGATYTAADANSTENISALTTGSFLVNGSVPPLGTFVLERIR